MTRKITITIKEENTDGEVGEVTTVLVEDSEGDFQERIGDIIGSSLDFLDYDRVDLVGSGVLIGLLKSKGFSWLGWASGLADCVAGDDGIYLDVNNFLELCKLYVENQINPE